MNRFLVFVCTCVVVICLVGVGPRVRAAAPDIVLYASDVTTILGNWSRAGDISAAGGQLMSSGDAGWAKTDAPLARPADYFEVPFTATANTPYRVWFRLRAASNSKFNDSVWVQYSDAIDVASGVPVYAIGSASALDVNLETCAGCGESSWGWQDGAYWLMQASTVRFSTTGTHVLRVQTREDGVQIDQIVLSASTYLAASPGQPRSDATIVAKPGTGGSVAPSRPYGGAATALPGTMVAANFDEGGAEVAYRDDSAGNAGGAYRTTDVDIASDGAGGYVVGWVSPREWLAYTVTVAAAGRYDLAFRVASVGVGGTFHLEMHGVDVTGPLRVPDTGGWLTWQTVTASATLSGGLQVARLVMDTPGTYAVGNFAALTVTAAATSSSGGLAPFRGTPVALPGRVAAADFDEGGEGVAYHDESAGNAGGMYRATNVDVAASSEGGYTLGWIGAKEWVNYTVDVTQAGRYTVQLRVAAPGDGGALHLGFNTASSVWTTLPIPATGGWQKWTTVSVPVTLGAGRQQLTLYFDTGGYNVSWIDVR